MKKFVSIIIIILILLPVLNINNISYAVSLNDSAVFIKQSQGGRCTLASAVMMLRRRAIVDGLSNWNSITEDSIAPVCWCINGVDGLLGSFSYSGMNVGMGTFYGDGSNNKSALISLLNNHPEGIVGYNRGEYRKHAVLITDYDASTDTFYCADPSTYYPSGRIPLTSAYLPGNTQAEKLISLDSYWYITNKSGSPATEAPSNATLSINKSVFSVGETVCFSSSCNVGASYTMGIDKDGTRIYTGVVGSYFEKSFSEPGNYSAYVSAWNSAGLIDSNRVNFTVYNSAPSTSKLTIDKSVVVVGQEITFNCDAENATGYTIGIDKGNERILTQDIGKTFTKSFTDPGKYSAYVSAWNANGLLDSNRVYFVVYDSAPTSSELRMDKDAICVGDSIQFTCVSEEATGYTIGINKDGVRIFTQDISKVFTKSFNEAGLYTAYVTSWNTRGICDSAKVSFEVYNTIPDGCNITVDKQLAKVGDIVKLEFDAHNAKLYEVGTYINGERVWVTPARGNYNELELELDAAGIYEVWASAYNEYGYCDSEHITFIAYSKDNAVVLKNDNSVRVIKEIDISDSNYSCIVALYEDKKLIKMVNESNLNSKAVLDKKILCSDKYDEIKVMVWNSLSGLKPLCEAEVIPSSEFIVE